MNVREQEILQHFTPADMALIRQNKDVVFRGVLRRDNGGGDDMAELTTVPKIREFFSLIQKFHLSFEQVNRFLNNVSGV